MRALVRQAFHPVNEPDSCVKGIHDSLLWHKGKREALLIAAVVLCSLTRGSLPSASINDAGRLNMNARCLLPHISQTPGFTHD